MLAAVIVCISRSLPRAAAAAALALALQRRRLDLLADCLAWRHLCPTAPDTLAAYPFADDDPFVMTACPHVLFAGNQPAYESRLHTGAAQCCVCVIVCAVIVCVHSCMQHCCLVASSNCVSVADCPYLLCCAGPRGEVVRLVAVPSFHKTGVAVLLNLRTLEPQPLTFQSS